MAGKGNMLHFETKDGHWIEWATGVISLLLVLAVIGWIAFRAITTEPSPPRLEVHPLLSETVSEDHRINFTVRNEAPKTAAAVTIRAVLTRNLVTLEEVDVTFDYVPGESEVKGTVIFQTDPTDASLRIGAVSYREP